MFKFILVSTLFVFAFCTPIAYAKNISLPVFSRIVHQDSAGFMWFGTEAGIMRYDGNELLDLTKFNKSFINQNVFSIRNYNDELLFSGDFGVYTLNSKNEISQLQVTSSPAVDAIVKNNKLFILSDKSVSIYANGQLQKQRKIVGEPRKFLVQNSELYYLTTTQFCNFERKTCLDNNYIDAVAINNVVLLSSKQGLSIKHPNNSIEIIELLGVTYLFKAIQDNHLWVVKNQDVQLFDIETQQFIKHNYFRNSNNMINDIFQSSDQSIWLASNDVELLTKTVYQTTKTNLPAMTGGRGGLFEHRGKFYVGDNWGIAELNVNSGESTLIEGAPTHIYTMHSSKAGLFLGSYYGLFLFKDGHFKTLDISEPVLCIKRTQSNTILVCHGQQISEVNTSTFKVSRYKFGNSIYKFTHEITDTVVSEPLGRYVSTGTGLLLFSKSAVKHIVQNTSVVALYISQKNPSLLFAATLNSGVKVIQDGIVKKSLNLNSIGSKCTTINDWGMYVYVGCSRGIAKINTLDLSVVVFPLTQSIPNIAVKNGQFYTVTSNTNLLNWKDEIKGFKFTPEILFAQTYINGVPSTLNNSEIKTSDHIRVQVSLNDFSGGNTYDFRINGKLLKQLSNEVGFNTQLGLNTITVSGSNKLGISAHQIISFDVIYPFFIRWYNIVLYLFIFMFVIRSVQRHNNLTEQSKNILVHAFFENYHNMRHVTSYKLFKNLGKVRAHANVHHDVFSAKMLAGLDDLVEDVRSHIALYNYITANSLEHNICGLVEALNSAHSCSAKTSLTLKFNCSLISELNKPVPEFIFEICQQIAFINTEFGKSENELKLSLIESNSEITIEACADSSCYAYNQESHANYIINKLVELLHAKVTYLPFNDDKSKMLITFDVNQILNFAQEPGDHHRMTSTFKVILAGKIRNVTCRVISFFTQNKLKENVIGEKIGDVIMHFYYIIPFVVFCAAYYNLLPASESQIIKDAFYAGYEFVRTSIEQLI